MKSNVIKLWGCADCNYRTNIRNLLHEHRKCHMNQQQKDGQRLKAKKTKFVERQFTATSTDGCASVHSTTPQSCSPPTSAPDLVKYQCQECKTSSTRLKKILHYDGHRREHRMFVLCPHCEYLIDFSQTAMVRMKNHCLSSHIKVSCRRCHSHVFKGHQAGNVLSHFEAHLEQDEKTLQVGILQTGRKKCPHCCQLINVGIMGDHLKQHVIEDWSAVQDYFKTQLEKIGLESPSKQQSPNAGAPKPARSGAKSCDSAARRPTGKENSDKESASSFASLASIHAAGSKSPAMERWKCENCDFETDAPEIYMQHLVDNHNPKSLSDKGGI